MDNRGESLEAQLIYKLLKKIFNLPYWDALEYLSVYIRIENKFG